MPGGVAHAAVSRESITIRQPAGATDAHAPGRRTPTSGCGMLRST